jgi:hypothetical protein
VAVRAARETRARTLIKANPPRLFAGRKWGEKLIN